jgi:aldehyde:ferredoxin oxidoreductase
MAIPKGYAGKVAFIDLTKPEAKIVPTDKFWSMYDINPREWLGGDGIITKVLWKDFPKVVDPLSPENEVIIASGPWGATAAPQAGRCMLGSIGPEGGAFASGSFGWHWPAAMKWAGFDVIIVRGKSSKPVYVFIDDGVITFHDASHIWGKETGETVKMVREELAERFEAEIKVMTIGPAGENMVMYAPPCVDATSSPGRSGGGAVMGSKKLKAIAIRGTGEIQLHDSKAVLEASYQATKKLLATEPVIGPWKDHGATTLLSTVAGWPMNGSYLIENRRNADFPHYKNVGCLSCQSPCYHWLQLKEGKHAGLRHPGGHMTWLTTSLRNLELRDFNEWIYFERLTQELGIDPASFTQTYSFLVDCYDRGLLDPKDTDGIRLKRGDADMAWDVLRKTAYREGNLGNLIADGMEAAAHKIGGEAENLAPHVRGKPSLQRDATVQALIWSVGYLTSPRGGDWLRVHNSWELSYFPPKRDTYPKYTGHTNTEIYSDAVRLLEMPDDMKKQIFGDPPVTNDEWIAGTKGKALFLKWTDEFVCLFNSMVACMYGSATQLMFAGYGPVTYADLLSKITGWDMDYKEVMKVGERVFNLQRVLNYKWKGWDSKEDKFHDKRAYEPAGMGVWKGKQVPWDATLKEWYAIRGWSENGLPTKAKMKELGMGDLLKEVKLPD